jgi:hypothetical protein
MHTAVDPNGRKDTDHAAISTDADTALDENAEQIIERMNLNIIKTSYIKPAARTTLGKS